MAKHDYRNYDHHYTISEIFGSSEFVIFMQVTNSRLYKKLNIPHLKAESLLQKLHLLNNTEQSL